MGAGSQTYFKHAPRAAGDGPLQHATRYLAAGTYLRPGFERLVISELMDDRHRAVVPSYGFDLGPVLRHALRARRLRLARDAALLVLWTCLLIVSPVGALFYGVLVALAAFGMLVVGRRLPRWAGVLAAVAVFGWLALTVSSALLASLFDGLTGTAADDFGDGFDSTGPAVGPSGSSFGLVMLVLLFGLALGAVIFGHFAIVLRTLSRELAPGATGPGPDTGSARARAALERIGSAQNGNITLYAGQNPFIGAGDFDSPYTKAWSIVLELDRIAADKLGDEGKPAARVDPVVMYERIREAVRAMRDEWPARRPGDPAPDQSQWLPPNERVVSLVIGDHVIGHGACDQRPAPAAPGGGHPLIDPRGDGVPYSLATGPALDAIMRHPQAAARYYQRISVGAQSQPVVARDQRTILDAEEQDFSITTFVHLAVEGRMLYAQFAAVPLPPIRDDFRIVDALPSWDLPALAGNAFLVGWREAPFAALLPVPRTAATLWQMARGALTGAFSRSPAARTVYNYGARLSVRELAAAPDFATYMQVLDIVKYTRMVQQRVNDTLLDHLENECRIDVSAYREQAMMLANSGVIITGGNVSGQVAAGSSVNQRRSGGGAS
ncbi:hypothetical protein ACFVH6_22780 [Spirillospora sp. NPDC127200]